MSSSTIFIVATFSIIAFGLIEVVVCDNCPNVKPFSSFNPSRIGGQWYVQKIAVVGLDAPNVKCMMRTITYEDNLLKIHVDSLDAVTNEAYDTDITLIKSGTNGVLYVKNELVKEVHTVVSAEYGSYVIFFSCFSLSNCHGYFVIGMTKEKLMSTNTARKLEAAFQRANLDKGLKIVDQTNCSV